MLGNTTHARSACARSARLAFTAALALVLAACSTGVTRAPEIGLQVPQFDEPGEQAGSLTVSLSEKARTEAADNLKFNKVETA